MERRQRDEEECAAKGGQGYGTIRTSIQPWHFYRPPGSYLQEGQPQESLYNIKSREHCGFIVECRGLKSTRPVFKLALVFTSIFAVLLPGCSRVQFPPTPFTVARPIYTWTTTSKIRLLAVGHKMGQKEDRETCTGKSPQLGMDGIEGRIEGLSFTRYEHGS